MSVETEPRATDRGASDGPPVAVRAKGRELPRLGPLPEPSLADRLRAGWSVADLVPPLDPRQFTAREWRRAGGLALAAHAVLLAALVVGSRYGMFRPGPDPEDLRPEITMINPDDFPSEVKTAEGGSEEVGGTGEPAGGSESGGSSAGTAPVTQGALPRTAPAPVVAPTLAPPPLVAPSLPVSPAVQGPQVDVPAPASTGLPDAPPAPGEPSLGSGGGEGVGDGKGSGAGNNTGSGVDTPGSGGGPGGGRGAPQGGPPVDGTGVGPGAGPGRGAAPVANRPVRMTRRARPVATQAMIAGGVFGTVRLEVTIGPDGSIQGSPRVIQPQPNGGTQAAIEALYRCRFLPAIRNGQYVAEKIVVTFDAWQL